MQINRFQKLILKTHKTVKTAVFKFGKQAESLRPEKLTTPPENPFIEQKSRQNRGFHKFHFEAMKYICS